MYYVLAVVVGAFIGAAITWLVMVNNQAKAIKAMGMTEEQFNRLKGGKG